MKVLHLASFTGNIGDLANHSGARVFFPQDFEYTELEIREFYWGERKFDDSFVDLCNEYDLVIIGGGNYFELWVESATGTSIDLSIEVLKKIKTKILFYALGCDAGQGVPSNNLAKFSRFLDYLFASDQFLVSVRNDGSLDTIRNLLGETYASHIYKVPDGGFFATFGTDWHPDEVLPYRKTTIAVNLAGDMVDKRFPLVNDYGQFLESFCDIINKKDFHFVFVPHIYKDIDIISNVLDCLDDKVRRTRISVAPYIPDVHDYILGLYQWCDLVLGNRFHANVCPIGMGIPTIGLINYPQVEKLYKELGIPEMATTLDNPYLEALIDIALNETATIKGRYTEIKLDLTEQMNNFQSVFRKWMS